MCVREQTSQEYDDAWEDMERVFQQGFDDGEGGYSPNLPDNPVYMRGYNCGKSAPW